MLVVAVTGCAAISGLGDYEEMPASGNTALLQPVGEDGASSEAGVTADDASVGDDTGTSVDPLFDAGEYPDVDFDAPPPCGTTCGGCCMNGSCVGGQSVTTCGIHGDLCEDCTSMGGACSAGACTTPVKDAGVNKPSCTSCAPCIPVYQSACCKTDDTCGCKTNFGGSGSCN
jgi:hypothetical protein